MFSQTHISMILAHRSLVIIKDIETCGVDEATVRNREGKYKIGRLSLCGIKAELKKRIVAGGSKTLDDFSEKRPKVDFPCTAYC